MVFYQMKVQMLFITIYMDEFVYLKYIHCYGFFLLLPFKKYIYNELRGLDILTLHLYSFTQSFQSNHPAGNAAADGIYVRQFYLK